MGTTPSTFPASVASFTTNTFDFDPLVAGETISISAQLSSGQGILQTRASALRLDRWRGAQRGSLDYRLGLRHPRAGYRHRGRRACYRHRIRARQVPGHCDHGFRQRHGA